MNTRNEQQALSDAAKSLRTIADLSGGNEYLMTIGDVRAYANNRASVAEAALAAQPAPAAAQEPVAWQFWHEMPGGGEWRNGAPDHLVKNLRRNTEAAGIPTRDLYAAPVAAEPVEVIRDDDGEIVLVKQSGKIIASTCHAGGKRPAAPGDAHDDRFPNGLADAIAYADAMEEVAGAIYAQVFGHETDGSDTGTDLLGKVLRELRDNPKGAALAFEVPAGWALVPETMQLTPENVEQLADTLRGMDDGEPWCGGVMWVGEIKGDEGEPPYYGLNVGNIECLEEGSVNIVEFGPLDIPNDAESQQAAAQAIVIAHTEGYRWSGQNWKKDRPKGGSEAASELRIWGIEKPGSMPKLFGVRYLAEMNWYPDEGYDLICMQVVERVQASDAEVRP